MKCVFYTNKVENKKTVLDKEFSEKIAPVLEPQIKMVKDAAIHHGGTYSRKTPTLFHRNTSLKMPSIDINE